MLSIVRRILKTVLSKNSLSVVRIGRGCLSLIVAMSVVLLSGCAAMERYDEAKNYVPIPARPVPIGPVSSADLSQLPVIVFSWIRTEHATGYEFHIHNALSEEADNYKVTGLNNDNNCRQNICGVKVRLTLPDSSGHVWRVRALNEAGVSEWASRSFTWDTNSFQGI